MNIEALAIGQRIQLHPATDRWMRGDRYGEVVRVNRRMQLVTVKMDASSKLVRLNPQQIGEIVT